MCTKSMLSFDFRCLWIIHGIRLLVIAGSPKSADNQEFKGSRSFAIISPIFPAHSAANITLHSCRTCLQHVADPSEMVRCGFCY